MAISIFQANAYADNLHSTTLKIGTDNHQPPYSYVNDNGTIKGFYLDVIQAIAIDTGIDIEISPTPWYQIMDDLLISEEIDAILGINAAQSGHDLILTNQILMSSEAIFVRNDNRFIVNLEDLINNDVAVQKESPTVSFLEKYVDSEHLVLVENQQQGIQMIMMGQVDAFVGDRLTGLYTIQKWKQENFIKIVGEPINETKYAIAFRTGNEEYVSLFNMGLKDIEENGTYEKIYKKWFGDTLPANYRWTKSILTLLGVIIAFGAVFLAITLRWNSALKIEVEKRTKDLNQANNQLVEQKKILEGNNKFKEEILESMLSGILTLNKEGIVTFLNSKSVEFANNNKEEIVGNLIEKTIFNEFFIGMELEKTLKEGHYYRSIEANIEHDDRIRVYNCNLYPLKNSENTVMGAILNFRDITEEREIRKELMRKDKMQSLGLMLAGMAHEIRNPLMSIKTLVDLLPTKFANQKYREKFISIVPEEVDRLNNLISDLLEYTKPRQPKMVYFNLEKLINGIVPMFSDKISENSIKFKTMIDKNLMVYADMNQLKQVMINLILNSIEASEVDGEIKISAYENNEQILIEVKDNGKGISARDLEYIFEPFYTTKINGVGLGLFTCYQIIKENNGALSISSKENFGTVATIKLTGKILTTIE